jgi:TRAP-type C4-dicarboxylate transport system substrate-binding protein
LNLFEEMYNTDNAIAQKHKEEHHMNSAAGESGEKPIELVFHNIHDHGTEIADMWMNEVKTRTGGRVRFRKTSGEDPGALKAADLVRDVPAMGDRYPLLNLIQIPFIFPSATVGSRVIAQLYMEFPELRDELSDVKVVGLGIGAILAIFSTKTWGPIRTLEDFKGARTRSMPLIDPVIEAFGAKPMLVGWFEMPRLLETGKLDALVLGVLPGHMFKLADGVAPYCTVAGKKSITMHPMRMYMKWDTWNSLPPDIRNIIEAIGPAGPDCWYAVQSGRDADTHLREALEYIRQKGELIEVAPKELKRWRMLIDPLRESAVNDVEVKGLPARRFFKRMNELVEEYT